MKHSDSTNPQDSARSATLKEMWHSFRQQFQGKRISYLTVPLLVMATVTEFVILATGWKYQQVVCLPKGMGVTFFGIGPIGATILAVELLKLPLAIWTASRFGWQKVAMLAVGLPMICLLTFQLVKDMAVYEMGVAMTPASQFLEKAMAEETKISQLNGELSAVEQKRTDRDTKLAELAARKAKARADLEESIKRNDESRQDAISLTDYQKKELSEVDVRQATIIRQFDADAAQLNKAIADLRAQRETEVARAAKWNAEEARIDNAYKVKLAAYTNKKAAYEKDKAEYESANVLKRQLMKEPVDPGVAPEREANTILKPTLVAEIDAQIKAKEAELAAVHNKRRERVAQVDADARQLRADFDRRSSTKREEADRKREELTSAQAALAVQFAAEEKQINDEYAAAAQKVDAIRADLDGSRKKAEGYYEEREAAIKNTQVHRIATTVEIVRGLFMGQRPVSIKATAKERGDLFTDQISMVRIWVYPVLAFIVAFLPTLMVEIGFSTIFKPEQKRPAHRLGLFGRRMHWLYTRAGRLKVLRAERIAREATAEIAARDEAVAAANAWAENAQADKEAALQKAREVVAVAAAEHEAQLKEKEAAWVAKFTDLADSLNRAVVEKDALRDFQKSEIERQIQMRQNAWSDRLAQLRQELDDQRTTAEAERTAMMQEHQRKLMEVTEECKTQVIQARRQMSDAELAGVEKNARLTHDLKAAMQDRDTAEAQLKHLADSFALQLSQAKEDTAREVEKAVRQEKHRFERQQLEFEKTLRQREEGFEHRLQQREQELALALDTRVAEEKSKLEQAARIRESELERKLEVNAREADARWTQEVQQREDLAQARLKQREQQLQAQVEEQSRRRELEFERQLDAQTRKSETRLREESQQKELAFHARLKQREQELAAAAAARDAELQSQRIVELREREQEWTQQTELRVRAVEIRMAQEAEQKDGVFESRLRQRDQQWQVKLDAARAEIQAQTQQDLRRREAELAEAQLRDQRELEARLRKEMQEKNAAALIETQQRERDLVAQLETRAQAQQQTEKERDEARQSAAGFARQVQELKSKLSEVSSLLSGWKNAAASGNGDGNGEGSNNGNVSGSGRRMSMADIARNVF